MILYYIILYHIILYHIILYYIILYYIILYCNILYHIISYHIVSYRRPRKPVCGRFLFQHLPPSTENFQGLSFRGASSFSHALSGFITRTASFQTLNMEKLAKTLGALNFKGHLHADTSNESGICIY